MTYTSALQFSIKSITRKRQTEARIREKLARRFPQADADQVVARLKELNYLNDKDFSSAWVNYRSLSSPRGKYALRQELKRKGIQEEDMSQALEDYSEHEAIAGLAAKKWPVLKDASIWKRKEKLQRFLLSRGFTISEVIEVVNSVARGTDV